MRCYGCGVQPGSPAGLPELEAQTTLHTLCLGDSCMHILTSLTRCCYRGSANLPAAAAAPLRARMKHKTIAVTVLGGPMSLDSPKEVDSTGGDLVCVAARTLKQCGHRQSWKPKTL